MSQQTPARRAALKKTAAARQSTRARAGLVLSPSRVGRQLRAGQYAPRVGAGAAIYLTAVLEYVAAEALELAGNVTRDDKRKRITPRDLFLGLRNDEELNTLVKDVTLPAAGALPIIHARLLPTTKKGGKLLAQAAGF